MLLVWILAGVVTGVVTGVLAAFLMSKSMGYERLAVLSGSMEPTISTGDLVLSKEVRPLGVRVGDVVTFRDPKDRSRLITHRVRRYRTKGQDVRFVTKGDANNTVETWTVPAQGSVGRVEVKLPKLGYLFSWIGYPKRRIFLLLVPAVLLGALEVRSIWRSRQPEPGRGAKAGVSS